MSSSIAVISGLGNCAGTGAATARAFSLSLNYKVALVSRPRPEILLLKKEIEAHGGQAEIFNVEDYNYKEMIKVFEGIDKKWPESRIKFGLFNTGAWSMIPFLKIKEIDIQRSVDTNIVSATIFAQSCIERFITPTSEAGEKGGTIIFTGATSAWRGLSNFGAFSAGKGGLRNLSQSIAREFGKSSVHSAFVVVDGVIKTKRTLALFGTKDIEKEQEQLQGWIDPASIAKCYLYLHSQTPDAWTLEMDLRPFKEKF